MGVLSNPKHEVFAQQIARGETISKSYVLAGFSPNSSNASRLRLDERIKARIAELQAQKTAAVELAQLTAAEKARVDTFFVLRNLRRNALMAMRAGDRAAAARSLELIGRHLSMFTDKKELQINVVDDSDAYLVRLLELVGSPVVEHEPQPLAIEDRGTDSGFSQ